MHGSGLGWAAGHFRQTGAGRKIQPGKLGMGFGQVALGGVQAAGDVVPLFPAEEGAGGEHDVADHALAELGRALPLAQGDAFPPGQDGVVEYLHLSGNVVVGLDAHGGAVAVDEHVVVEGEIAFTLEQGLAGVLPEQVGVDQVAILAARPSHGEMAHQHVRPGVGLPPGRRGRPAFLGEDVAADDRVMARLGFRQVRRT
jgi:hypothetical protein